MALILCPECKREVSDKATTCPHCGYPLSGAAQECADDASGQSAQKPLKPKKARAVVTAVFVSIVIITLAAAGVWWVFLRPGKNYDERVVYERVIRYEQQYMFDSLEAALDEYFDTYNSDARYYSQLKELHDRFTTENTDWKSAEQIASAAAISAFLDQHPNGYFRDKACELLDSLSFAEAVSAETREALENYISCFSDGKFVQEAETKLAELDNPDVTDDERLAVGEVLVNHFEALASSNRAALRMTIAHNISSYIGKTDPAIEDIYAYMDKIHQSGRTIRFDIDDANVVKLTSGGKTSYNVQFSLQERIYMESNEEGEEGELKQTDDKSFVGTAVVNEAMRISSLVLRKE